MTFCTDRYGCGYSHGDCECYWEEMRADGIAPGDIVGLIRQYDGVDLIADLSRQRAHDRCIR